MRLQLRDCLIGRERDLRLPSLDSDVPIFGVDAGNHRIAADSVGKFAGKGGVDGGAAVLLGKQRGAEDDAAGARVEDAPSAVGGVDAAAHYLAREALGDLLHQRDELSPCRMAASRSMSCCTSE